MNNKADELLARAYALQTETESKALYRDWAQTYDETMLDGLGYVTPQRTADLLSSALHDRQANILDVGAGTGLAGVELARHGFVNLDALDYSAQMLAVAGKRGIYQNLLEADLNQPLELENETYDALICTGTFTHAHVGAACLDELFRILKPGGGFACTVQKDIWDEAGFKKTCERLENSDIMTTQSFEPGTYFETSTEPDGWFILWQKAPKA